MVKLDTALGLDGEPDVAALIEEAVAFTASQGVLIAEDAGYTHAPVSLLPNDFPLDQYIRAVELAPLFNMLVSEARRRTLRDFNSSGNALFVYQHFFPPCYSRMNTSKVRRAPTGRRVRVTEPCRRRSLRITLCRLNLFRVCLRSSG